jgi:type III restriction enzyme
VLTFKFDANQQHQLDAIASVVGLFEGRPPMRPELALAAGGLAVSNLPEYDELALLWLRDNLDRVRNANNMPAEEREARLVIDDGPTLDPLRNGASHAAPSFTLEMETGTGKTYVYLRAIYELRQRYGFGKFVIVVPSVAIYEGVKKSVALLKGHLRSLYANETVDLIEYDGEQMGRIGSYARSPNAGILLMTLDAFNKAGNKIYKASEKLPGEWLPYEYIQRTRPIVILDEPQRMGGESAQKAIRTLHPLVTLRFSATHRESPNLCYRLTPIEAFRKNLVKKIQVIGVTQSENVNDAPLQLLEVSGRGAGITARLRGPVLKAGQSAVQEFTLRLGDDLGAKTGQEAHQGGGFVVDNLRAGDDGFVVFANGDMLGMQSPDGQVGQSVMRAQIAQTIKYHFRAQAEQAKRGVKVLSLFFIDRVAHYTDADGVIKRLFNDEYQRALSDNPDAAPFKQYAAEDVRTHYFAKKKKAKSGLEEFIGDANSKDFKQAEQDAYKLIMREKERLLSADEPRCFIFAHSALREGWDNPNVFQICTLRESASDIDRRQAIGRGLRLCVNQNGERVLDDEANTLTVIANESYGSFSKGLQEEYVKDGDAAPPPPKRPRDNQARRNDAIFHDGFQLFWRKLQTPLRYALKVNSEALIREAVTRLNGVAFPMPMITIERGRVVIDELSITVKKIYASQGKAVLAMRLLDEAGEALVYEGTIREGEDLAKKTKSALLKPFGNFRILQQGGEPVLALGNADVEPLVEGQTFTFSPGANAIKVSESKQFETPQRFPVFNIVARAARELGITKPTLLAMFKGMSRDQKVRIFRNPEGFANVFVATVREVLAEHLTQRIAFEPDERAQPIDAEDLFPALEQYPQKEIVEAGARGLYDKMQVDSEVEREFVRVLTEDGRVEFYFKFPPRFRIDLPRLIGDYNPDWGIARIDTDGKPVIYKIRETKGSTDLSKLRFSHEPRKIKCAQRYFAALGIDYRPITAATPEWWKAGAGQTELG